MCFFLRCSKRGWWNRGSPARHEMSQIYCRTKTGRSGSKRHLHEAVWVRTALVSGLCARLERHMCIRFWISEASASEGYRLETDATPLMGNKLWPVLWRVVQVALHATENTSQPKKQTKKQWTIYLITWRIASGVGDTSDNDPVKADMKQQTWKVTMSSRRPQNSHFWPLGVW